MLSMLWVRQKHNMMGLTWPWNKIFLRRLCCKQHYAWDWQSVSFLTERISQFSFRIKPCVNEYFLPHTNVFHLSFSQRAPLFVVYYENYTYLFCDNCRSEITRWLHTWECIYLCVRPYKFMHSMRTCNSHPPTFSTRVNITRHLFPRL